MINKRLIQEVRSSRKYVGWQVACQWAMLLCNIVMVLVWSMLFQRLFFAQAQMKNLLSAVLVAVVCMVVRFVFSRLAAKMGYFAGKEVKQLLREKIYTKLVQMGTSYQEKAATSEMVQLSVEGVEQLETYFGAYLPQFFYSMLAPLTLFAVLGFISLKAAVVLLICVPLIPVSIVFVQKFAKKLLNRYWWQYTSLGDGFLENLQGMTTLKIYRADDRKQQEMNQQAEQFRKVTMRVLTMQLNSITVMDLVAFGAGRCFGVAAVAGRSGHAARCAVPGLSGVDELFAAAGGKMPLHGEQNILLRLSCALLSPGDAAENTRGHEVFRPKNAAVSSCVGAAPRGGHDAGKNETSKKQLNFQHLPQGTRKGQQNETCLYHTRNHFAWCRCFGGNSALAACLPVFAVCGILF